MKLSEMIRNKKLRPGAAALLILFLAAVSYWWLTMRSYELVFEDDFARPDSKEEGNAWHDPEGYGQIVDQSLQVTNGWTNLSVGVEGDVRFEFDVRPIETIGSVGFFIAGDGGFWSGYRIELPVVEEGSVDSASLEKVGRHEMAAPGVTLPLNQAFSVWVEKRDHRIRVAVDDQVVLDFIDFFPLSGENHNDMGFIQYSSSAYRCENVRVYKIASRGDEALAEAEAAWQEADYATALEEYRDRLRWSDAQEKEVCQLMVGQCMFRLARFDEALAWYRKCLRVN